jgi:glutathione reductase (NADPH)
LTPTANAEGYTAVQNLLSEDDSEVSYGPVPAVAFTIPAIASVGLTESQANEQNKLFRVNEADASGWGSVKKVCESTAYYKVLVDEESDQIIGAHLIGPTAAETINLFAMAIKTRLTSTDLQSLTLAFPTSGYNIREMV